MLEAQTILKYGGQQAETLPRASSKRLLATSILGAFGMRTIPLTKGKVAIVDDADYEWLKQRKWHYHIGKQGERFGYAASRNKKGQYPYRKLVMMNNVIMNPPKGYEVDHINHNRIDNRRCNLRICTPLENCKNKTKFITKKGVSHYKGAYLYNHRWASYISVNKKTIYLGRYPNEIEAAKAYDRAALKYFGEYAGTNFNNKKKGVLC
jgi:hypothetical protein